MVRRYDTDGEARLVPRSSRRLNTPVMVEEAIVAWR
jgi:hypothetical protein